MTTTDVTREIPLVFNCSICDTVIPDGCPRTVFEMSLGDRHMTHLGPGECEEAMISAISQMDEDVPLLVEDWTTSP